jgi:hypothetical protein
MTREWDRVMFGQPEEAKRALQAADLNYFLSRANIRSLIRCR